MGFFVKMPNKVPENSEERKDLARASKISKTWTSM